MKQKRFTAIKMTDEDLLQQAQVNWFRYQYPQFSRLLFAIPNGGQRSFTTGARMKLTGAIAGVPDLFLSIPNTLYHGLYIENKVGRNQLTNTQKMFRENVLKQGYAYNVIRNIDDFMLVITEYLKSVHK